MRLSISGLRTWKGRDGHGWQGTLKADGRAVAFVTDDGDGGPIRWEVADPGRLAVIAEAHGTTCDGPAGWPVCDGPLDTLVAKLADDADTLARLKRAARGAVVFRVPGDPDGEWRTVKPNTEAARAHVRAKYPDAFIFAGEIPEGGE